jgi:hypothetical protein
MNGISADSGLVVVTIMFEHGQRLAFYYNTRARAEAAYKKLTAPRGENDFEVEISDDYGMMQTIDLDHVILRGIENPKLIGDAQGRMAIITARAQAAANKKAASDPTLQLLTPGHPMGMMPRA